MAPTLNPPRHSTIGAEDTPLEFEMSDHFRLAIHDNHLQYVVDVEIPFPNGHTLKRRSIVDKKFAQAVGGIVTPSIDLGSDVRLVRAKKEGEH